MKQAPPPERPNSATTPPQFVWATLSTLQQQAVARIVMRVCQELAADRAGRNGGEHDADR